MKRRKRDGKRNFTLELFMALMAALMFFATMYAGYLLGKMTNDHNLGNESSRR